MLSPVLSPKKTHILNPCCSPSLPPRITGEKRGIFGGVSTLKWGQNGPAPEENETFFDKFWVNLSKKTNIRSIDSKIRAIFHVGQLAYTLVQTRAHAEHFAHFQEIRSIDSRCWCLNRIRSRIRAKDARNADWRMNENESTNVRHTAIARAMKDSALFACKLQRRGPTCLRRRKGSKRTCSQEMIGWSKSNARAKRWND